MSYGVALRNGVPFTLGTIAALCTNATGSAWSPLALWPDGIATPGMWISPRDLTSQWADYLGTTPVATPGTVADSANPVGLALDIRAGATVLTDPGNHMLQSTSVDRPLLSARVNLLKYTEDFSNGYWKKNGVSPFGSGSVANATTAPDGTLTADKITSSATIAAVVSNNESVISVSPGTTYSASCYFKSAGKGFAYIQINAVAGPFTAAFVAVDLSTGVAGSVVNLVGSFAATNVLATPEDNGFYRLVFTVTTNAGNTDLTIYNGISDSISDRVTTIDSSNGIYVWGAQLAIGDADADYQSVPGDGSTYASGPPIAQLYDGVDDGMATAAFSAGTLINGMDCMIPVRRDSAASTVAGLYTGAGVFFGAASGDTWTCHAGAGAPTVWVDNTQLTGGTAVAADVLNAALTPGSWHILEFRGLDLSAWTQMQFGGYPYGYALNGTRGDILLYPSTASTTDKDAARQWLADYYGVTLP